MSGSPTTPEAVSGNLVLAPVKFLSFIDWAFLYPHNLGALSGTFVSVLPVMISMDSKDKGAGATGWGSSF